VVVPAAYDALRVGDLTKLTVDQHLIMRVQEHLDQYRLLTTSLQVREPQYIGVKVYAEIVAGDYSQPDVVRTRALDALRNFLSPLALDDSRGPEWEGWPFGKDLYVTEIYSLLEKVPGVQYVMVVRLSHRPIVPLTERPETEGDGEAEEAPALTELASNQRSLVVPRGALLVSLGHDVQMVTLEGD
jgi:hypothetical protein